MLCGAGAPNGLCAACRGDLARPDCCCPRCGATTGADVLCGRCQRRPPAFHRTFAAFSYHYPLDALIQRFKYRADLACGRVLGELLADELAQRAEPLPDALLPVPLHWSRLCRRGFNQSVELTRPIARRLRLPMLRAAVRRSRRTPPQARMPLAERRGNVRGAFSVRQRLDLDTVAIVDDVMTTGETANALAKALRGAGVRAVQIWVLARA